MPIYEFRCKSCGNIFEYLCFSSSESMEVRCPHCGGEQTERLLSTFSSYSSNGLQSSSSASCSPRGGFS